MAKLIQLYLRGFKKFDKLVINFSPGLNFIYGPNEVGKSTVLESILISLFSYNRSNDSPASWYNGDICTTYLKYKIHNGEIFKLVSDLNIKKRYIEKEDGTKIYKEETIANLIKNHLGFDDKKVFENTAFVKQSHIEILEDNTVRNKIKDMIETVLIGRSGSSATKTIAKMEKKKIDYERMIKGYYKKGVRTIEGYEEKLDSMKRILIDVRKKEKSISENTVKHKDVSHKFDIKSKELVILEENYRSYRSKEDLLIKQLEVTEKHEIIKRVLNSIYDAQKFIKEKKEMIIEYNNYSSISKKDFLKIKQLIEDINEIRPTLSTKGNIDTEEIIDAELERMNNIIVDINKKIDERKEYSYKMEKYKGFSLLSKDDISNIQKLIYDIDTNNVKLEGMNSNLKIKAIVTTIDTRYLFLLIIGVLLSVVIIGIPLVIYSYKRLKIKVETEMDDQERIRKRDELARTIQYQTEELRKYTKYLSSFQKDLFLEQYNDYKELSKLKNGVSLSIKQLTKKELNDPDIEEDDAVNIKKIERKYELLRNGHNKDLEQVSNIRDTLLSKEKMLEDVTRNIEHFDKDFFISTYGAYDKLREDIKSKLESLLESTKHALNIDEFTDDVETNIRKIEEIESRQITDLSIIKKGLEEYRYINFDMNDFGGLDVLRKEVELLSSERLRLDTTIKTTTDMMRDPEELKEEIDYIDDNILNTKRRIEEYTLAIKYLKMAEENVRKRIIPIIEKNSKPILAEITNGRYSDINIDETLENIKIRDPISNKYVDIDLLSRGTQDQIYFTLRIVILDQLSGYVNTPLILDDPFNNFDYERIRNTLRMIKNIANDKQIILSSHRQYDKEIEDFSSNIILLDTKNQIMTSFPDDQYAIDFHSEDTCTSNITRETNNNSMKFNPMSKEFQDEAKRFGMSGREYMKWLKENAKTIRVPEDNGIISENRSSQLGENIQSLSHTEQQIIEQKSDKDKLDTIDQKKKRFEDFVIFYEDFMVQVTNGIATSKKGKILAAINNIIDDGKKIISTIEEDEKEFLNEMRTYFDVRGIKTEIIDNKHITFEMKKR